jgi:hypothetical protein
MMGPEVINFAVDLVEKSGIEKIRIVFFDRYSDAVFMNIVNQHIAGSAEDSQDIVLLSFLKIYSVVLHSSMAFCRCITG